MNNTHENELTPDARRAVCFLNWFSPNGPHRLETIVSEGNGRLGVRTFRENQLEELATYLTEQNTADQKRNVYFLPSAPFLTGKRAKANIHTTDVLQVDVDAKDFKGTEAEQLEKAIALLVDHNIRPKGVPAPTAVCFTGGGYQAFWKLKEPIEVALAEELNNSLILILNGDVGTHDVSHLMRLPGSVNWLNDKKRAAGREPKLALLIEPANFKRPPVRYQVADFKIRRHKPNSSSAGQQLATNIEAVGDPEPLPEDLSEIVPSDPKWAQVLMTGENPSDRDYPSRSELVHAFNIRMLSHGMKPGHLLSILTDPDYGIGAHVLDQPQPLAYAKRQVANAQAYLDQSDGNISAKGNAEITVLRGQLPLAVDQAEQALIRAGIPIYQRFQSLVRVVRIKVSVDEGGVGRDSGALILKTVEAAWLREQFARTASWMVPTKDGEKRIDPPSDAATAYLARVGDWKLRFLQGITQSPTLRADGTVLQEPGYDPASGLIYDPGRTEFPQVPDAPSMEEAKTALKILSEPFREFAFAEEVDRSVALAALLTALVRAMFPSALLFAFGAPAAGSGKSLLAETIGVITTGHKPAMMSQGKSTEEDEKRLSSVLMAGDQVIVIDNCERPIRGDFLCSMLTQEMVKPRVLGKSEMRHVPTRCLVIATGNRLQFAGDISRRTLHCYLDAKVERPDKRQFDFDPRAEALRDRPKLVTAGLTVLRGYISAGRPQPLDKIGSFEQWNLIREALVWLGQPDPAATRESILAEDLQKEVLVDLLKLWWRVLGNSFVTLKELETMALDEGDSSARELTLELASNTRFSYFNHKSVGRFLAKHIDRIAGGLTLHADTDSSGVKHYRVLKVSRQHNTETPPKETPF